MNHVASFRKQMTDKVVGSIIPLEGDLNPLMKWREMFVDKGNQDLKLATSA